MWCVLEAPDFRFVEISKSYLDHFGLPPSLIGKPFADLPAVPDARKRELLDKLNRLVRTGTPFISMDEIHNQRTGEITLVRWVNTAIKGEAPGMAFRVSCRGYIVKDRRSRPRVDQLSNTA